MLCTNWKQFLQRLRTILVVGFIVNAFHFMTDRAIEFCFRYVNGNRARKWSGKKSPIIAWLKYYIDIF